MPLMGLALGLLGVGWNLGLVGGSALLPDAIVPERRAQTQGAADLVMGVAAISGTSLRDRSSTLWRLRHPGRRRGRHRAPLSQRRRGHSPRRNDAVEGSGRLFQSSSTLGSNQFRQSFGRSSRAAFAKAARSGRIRDLARLPQLQARAEDRIEPLRAG